jgi:hypothetical protein
MIADNPELMDELEIKIKDALSTVKTPVFAE